MGELRAPERVQTVVVGGGQAGLSVGYHLARRGLPFMILDAHERIGDAWRKRWDSLCLFTPACYDGLPGWPFPAPAWSYPNDEVADYLEAHAAGFDLPVRTGVRVDRLCRKEDWYVVAAGDGRFDADHVVVASTFRSSPAARPRHRGIPAGPVLRGADLLYALASSLVGGVGRDAEHVADAIANHKRGGKQ
jgi:cation diffusion facilitator CzcD-associated flavoprotein CzcO